MVRVIGSNMHGGKNEDNIVNALHNKQIKDINLNLREFIYYIANDSNIDVDDNTLITSFKESNNVLKQDIYIQIDGHTFAISLKMGCGNSVHQEKCEDFISYIRHQFSASDEICNAFRLFLWADGTYDGSGSTDKDDDGKIISRFNAQTFKIRYPREKAILQDFINNNEEPLIYHFLFEGRHFSKVDYIYHGTVQFGAWISQKKVIEHNMINSRAKIGSNRSVLSVGNMSIQSWNISLKGTCDHKRGQIQVKYASMKKDFELLMLKTDDVRGTFWGDMEEYGLTQIMNKNKSHKYWKYIFENENDFENYYIVRVNTHAKSKISEQVVFPKTDAYIIKANIGREFLLENEYVLTEKNLIGLSNKVTVPETGISVKMQNSSHYTYHKFTYNSFIKIFSKVLKNAQYIFYSLLLYSKEDEMFKNKKMAHDLNIDTQQFASYIAKKLNMATVNLLDKETVNLIRKSAQNELKSTINNNENIKRGIITGKGWYEYPYYVDYIFVKGDLVKLDFLDGFDFQITTGSGRSRGKYSIQIKAV